jgi:hypothetical protein
MLCACLAKLKGLSHEIDSVQRVAQASQRFKWERNKDVKGGGGVRECVRPYLLIVGDLAYIYLESLSWRALFQVL